MLIKRFLWGWSQNGIFINKVKFCCCKYYDKFFEPFLVQIEKNDTLKVESSYSEAVDEI